MPVELLAIGSGEVASADQVVAVGGSMTVCLKDAAGPEVDGNPVVLIQLKDNAGQYFTIDRLSWERRAVMIAAPGTYRFVRQVGSSCGVFSG